MSTSRLNVDFTVVISFNSSSYPQFESFSYGIDVSALTYSLDFSESIGEGTCGTMTCSLLKDPNDILQQVLLNAAYRIGSIITMRSNGIQMFQGYVTSVHIDQDDNCTLEARDILYYLGNKVSYLVGTNNNIQRVFEEICTLAGLEKNQFRFDGNLPPNSRLPFKHFSNETYFDIISYCANFHHLQTRQWYEPIVENGVIVLRDILGQRPVFPFGDGLFTGSFDRKIDSSNMVNHCTILLARTKDSPTIIDENLGGTPVLVEDKASIAKYGRHAYYEVARDVTQAVAQEYAQSIVSAYSEPDVELTINSDTGSSLVRAGRSVAVAFVEEGIFGRYIVRSVTHSFSGQTHTMQLSLYDSAYRSELWNELYNILP